MGLRLLFTVAIDDMTQRLMARVRELRETRGLSQEAFAELAGLKYKHYQAVEAGRKSNIQFATLVKLAKACGLKPWELLNFDAGPLAVAENAPKPGPQTTAAKSARKSPKRRSATKGN